MNKLVIIGGGEHAKVVCEAALLSRKWEVLGYLDDSKKVNSSFLKYLGTDKKITCLSKEHDLYFIFGIGSNNLRKKIYDEYPNLNWATVIHPTATVSSHAVVKAGVVILAKAVVNFGSLIKMHAIINTSVIIEHDCTVEKFAHIGPGSILGGGVGIGESVLVGLGSRVRDHTIISNDVVVGSGSVVIADVTHGQVVAGIPAKPISYENKKHVDISELCVYSNISIYEAMSLLANTGENIVFVVNTEKVLLGLITNGDVRNSLLSGKTMDTKVSDIMNTDFAFISDTVPRYIALQQMRAKNKTVLPVVNIKGEIVGAHFLTDFIGSVNLPNIAVIMAGGKGTRLGSITKNTPKPMLKVAGRPILEHIVLHLVSSGIKKVYIAVNHMSDVIKDYFKDGHDYGCEIKYLHEETPLGSAGALSLIEDNISDPIILLNGDLITQFKVEPMMLNHSDNNNKITIGVRDHVVHIPYGVLETEEGHVINILEKPEEHYIINGGVYIIEPELLSYVPKKEVFYATDLIKLSLEMNKNVGYHLLEGDWIDIGQKEQLSKARGE